jgi:hypothetical protein
MIGTPYYMSSEQCAGKKVTPASDQYSLGVVAYQMLSGHLPFTGEAVIDIIKKHCMDPPPPLGLLSSSTPPSLVAVIERALAKSPEDRFPNVAEFAGAFARAAGGEITVEEVVRSGEQSRRRSATEIASPVLGSRPLAEASQPEAARPESPPPPARPRRRAGLFMAGAGALGLAVLGVWIGPRWSTIVGGAVASRGDSITSAPLSSIPARDTTAAARTDSATAPAGAATDTAGAASSRSADLPAAAPTTSDGRLVLRSVPAGATVTLDGRGMRGTSFSVSSGRRHVVKVTLAGFDTWSDTVRLRGSQSLTRTVSMRQAQQAAPQEAAAPPQAPPTAAPSTTAAVPRPVTPQPAAPSGVAPTAGTARISVGSRPLASITINGRSLPANPVFDFEVPAGPVRIHFVWTDTTGLRSYDTVVVVGPGDSRNIGRVPLPRRQ